MSKSLTLDEARRMSREFAEVGVEFTPDRLRALSAGESPTVDEHASIHYAVEATENVRQNRLDNLELRRERLLRLNIAVWGVAALLLAVVLAVYLYEMAPLLNITGP